MLREACSPAARARRPPTSSRYCCDGRLGLVEPVGRLDHRVRGRVAVVVDGDVGAVRAERLGLLHDVEGTPLVQQHVGDHERLEPRAEARRRAADALRDRSELAVSAAQHRHDPVRFAQLVGAEDHDLVAVGGHLSIMAAASPAGSAARSGDAHARCARRLRPQWTRG